MFSIPICVFHSGSQEYFQKSVYWNSLYNFVYVIGDETNAHLFLDNPRVFHFHKDELCHHDFESFSKSFINYSTNNCEYELKCFLRVFYVKQLLVKLGINSIFHVDSDCIVFPNITDLQQYWIQNKISTDQHCWFSVQNNGKHTMHMVGSIHNSLLNHMFCDAFIQLCLDIYVHKTKLYLIEPKIKWHRDNDIGGGICDMTLYYLLFSQELIPKSKILNTNDFLCGQFDDTLCVFDHNIQDSYGTYGPCTFHMDSTTGLKHFTLSDDSHYYFSYCNPIIGCNDKLPIRALSIHFQGQSKKWIPELCPTPTVNNNNLLTSVYLCGCIKNCAQYLSRSVQHLIDIGDRFTKYKIILAYDSSIDDTYSTVKNMQSENENIIILQGNNAITNIRTQNISNARNRILEYIHQDNTMSADYMIMMDMDDVFTVSKDDDSTVTIDWDVFDHYVLEKNDCWDALSFYSSTTDSNSYYDAWALSFPPYMHSCWNRYGIDKYSYNYSHVNAVQKDFTNRLKRMDSSSVYDVYSAFGGFSIYKMSRFYNCFYHWKFEKNIGLLQNIISKDDLLNVEPFEQNGREDDCEHRHFHLMAKHIYNARIKVSKASLFVQQKTQPIVPFSPSNGDSKNDSYPNLYLWSKPVHLLSHSSDLWLKDTSYIANEQEIVDCICSVKDVLWIRNNLHDLYTLAYNLSQLDHPVQLITTDGDHPVPSSYHPFIVRKLLNCKNIISWKTQNYDKTIFHHKLQHFPIGLDFHTSRWFIGNGNIVANKSRHYDTVNTKNEELRIVRNKSRIFCDTHLTVTHNERIHMFHILRNNSNITFLSHPLTCEEIINRYSMYSFVLSPRGNGLDCHRTWELFLCGCIVITRTSSLDDMWIQHNLPVVILDEWDELNHDLDTKMEKWYAQYSPFTSYELIRTKMSYNYWLKHSILYRKPSIRDISNHLDKDLLYISNCIWNSGFVLQPEYFVNNINLEFMKKYLTWKTVNYSKPETFIDSPVLVVDTIHSCWAHAVVDCVLPWYLYYCKITEKHPDKNKGVTLFIRRRLFDMWKSNYQNLSQNETNFIGSYGQLLSVIPFKEIIFEHKLDSCVQFRHTYHFLLDETFEKSLWNHPKIYGGQERNRIKDAFHQDQELYNNALSFVRLSREKYQIIQKYEKKKTVIIIERAYNRQFDTEILSRLSCLLYQNQQQYCYDFKGIFYLENMSFPEQIKLLSETNVVFARHGAAIVNYLWLPKNSVVFDIDSRLDRKFITQRICAVSKSTSIYLNYEEFCKNIVSNIGFRIKLIRSFPKPMHSLFCETQVLTKYITTFVIVASDSLNIIVQSLLKQSNSLWKAIIVCDGTTVNSNGQFDKRFTVISIHKPIGYLGLVYNTVLSHVTTEWLSFIGGHTVNENYVDSLQSHIKNDIDTIVDSNILSVSKTFLRQYGILFQKTDNSIFHLLDRIRQYNGNIVSK